MKTDDSGVGELLTLARRSIVSGLGRDAPLPPPAAEGLPAWLLEPAASFVTLKRLGQLRGCVGHVEALRPLYADVWHNAWASAFSDSRFPPLAADELEDLEIGVSVLSPLERIAAGSEAEVLAGLEPGRHGLLLAVGPRRATFLPQVWQSLPDPRRFLAELKSKAGLPPEAWSSHTQAWRYTARSLGPSS